MLLMKKKNDVEIEYVEKKHVTNKKNINIKQ